MGTKPVAEHAWLQQLVGEWTVESVMHMGPDSEPVTGRGRETVTSLGGLWAHTHGTGTMPNGEEMQYFSALGYDVTFHEYRGCWFADVSSHLWRQVGTLSADGKVMTLDCEGPHMEKDRATALYRDVITIVDHDHRTLESFGQDEETGEWVRFMKADIRRVR
jgi:hypothetical protein